MSLSQKFHLLEEVSNSVKKQVEKSFDELFSDADSEDLIFASESEKELDDISKLATKIVKDFDNIIFVGTGASYTIPKMYLDFAATTKTNFYFLRNIDSKLINDLVKRLDPERTVAILISKSGETAEVVVNFLKLHEWLKKHLSDKEIKSRFIAITEEKPSELFAIAETIGCKNIVHPNVGGRFSVFTVVGLLAASLAGFDIKKMMSSVKKITHKLIKEKKSLIESVSFYHENFLSGNHHILLSYGEYFEGFNEWHSQLIHESLGKGGKGVISQTAIGAYDQHIRLQYLLDGSDKVFCSLLAIKKIKNDLSIKNQTKIKTLNYYSKNSFHETLIKNCIVVVELIKNSQKPLREVSLSQVNEEDICELIVRQIIELMLLAHLRGINPFGQPAIENIKNRIKEELNDA